MQAGGVPLIAVVLQDRSWDGARAACCVLRAACFARVSHRQGGEVPHQDGGWAGVHACVLRSVGRLLGSPAALRAFPVPLLLPQRDGGGVYHRDGGGGANEATTLCRSGGWSGWGPG